MRHRYQVQRRNMTRKPKLFFDADLICVSWINASIFVPRNLMKNWSLENVSDGHGRNPVKVYVSILSIILFNNSSTVLDMVKYLSLLVEFTYLVHQLLSLKGWPNQVSIKPWLSSLPALYHLSLTSFEKLCILRSLLSWFEKQPCWEGILVLQASSVFDSIDY